MKESATKLASIQHCSLKQVAVVPIDHCNHDSSY